MDKVVYDSHVDALPEAEYQARLRKVALRHGAAFLAAITLWGTADAWPSWSQCSLAPPCAT